MYIIPYFAELRKQGAPGRQKISQITRYMGIAFAFIEGYALSFAFIGKTGDPLRYMYIAVVLTAGTALLLWLGDQITTKGIGNGISVLIMAGILSSIPHMFIETFNALVLDSDATLFVGIISFSICIILFSNYYWSNLY